MNLGKLTEAEAREINRKTWDMSNHPIVIGLNQLAKQSPDDYLIWTACFHNVSYENARIEENRIIASNKDGVYRAELCSVSVGYSTIIGYASADVHACLERHEPKDFSGMLNKQIISQLIKQKRFDEVIAYGKRRHAENKDVWARSEDLLNLGAVLRLTDFSDDDFKKACEAFLCWVGSDVAGNNWVENMNARDSHMEDSFRIGISGIRQLEWVDSLGLLSPESLKSSWRNAVSELSLPECKWILKKMDDISPKNLIKGKDEDLNSSLMWKIESRMYSFIRNEMPQLFGQEELNCFYFLSDLAVSWSKGVNKNEVARRKKEMWSTLSKIDRGVSGSRQTQKVEEFKEAVIHIIAPLLKNGSMGEAPKDDTVALDYEMKMQRINLMGICDNDGPINKKLVL